MARAVKEWIGETDDQRAPKRVRDRIRDRHPTCYLCGRPFTDGKKVALDHVEALINGGENRESNLRPVHVGCHAEKTRADVAEKAKIAAKRQKHRRIVDAPKMQGAPMPTTKKAEQRKRAEAEKLPLPKRARTMFASLWPSSTNPNIHDTSD